MAEEAQMKKKVMVAIDESDFSHYALSWTLENIIKDSINSTEVVLFSVQPIASLGYITVASHGSAPVELIRSVQEQQRKFSLSLLERAKEICAKHGVIAETITEAGDPKDLICEAVQRLKVDLLILGSHGRGVLQRAFLGSVSNHCVHHAKCPVLVVKKTG